MEDGNARAVPGRLSRRFPETLASESDNFESDDFEGEALFRVGLTHGEAFAAAGADLAGRGFGHVVSHLRRLEDVLARWMRVVRAS